METSSHRRKNLTTYIETIHSVSSLLLETFSTRECESKERVIAFDGHILLARSMGCKL